MVPVSTRIPGHFLIVGKLRALRIGIVPKKSPIMHLLRRYRAGENDRPGELIFPYAGERGVEFVGEIHELVEEGSTGVWKRGALVSRKLEFHGSIGLGRDNGGISGVMRFSDRGTRGTVCRDDSLHKSPYRRGEIYNSAPLERGGENKSDERASLREPIEEDCSVLRSSRLSGDIPVSGESNGLSGRIPSRVGERRGASS